MIQITVRSPGRDLQIQLSAKSLVEKVKEAFAEEYGVPPRFQTLTFNNEELKDSDIIGKQSFDGVTLTLNILVALDTACRDLIDGNAELRERIILDLGKLGFLGGDVAINAIINCFEDADAHVRRAAAKALPLVAPKGDERAFAALIGAVCDEDQEVREATVGVFPEIAEQGNDKVIATVLTKVKLRDKAIRRTALQALTRVARRGDDRTVIALIPRLADRDASVREAAVQAIAEAARVGDDRAIVALTGLVPDKNENVRRAVMEALVLVTEKGDPRAINTVTGSLEDENWFVRRRAIQLLPRVAGKRSPSQQAADEGEEDVLETIATYCQNPDADIRRAALEALSEVAELDNPVALQAVEACFHDEDELVRRTAEHVHKLLTPPVDELEEAKTKPLWEPSDFVRSLVGDICTYPDPTLLKGSF